MIATTIINQNSAETIKAFPQQKNPQQNNNVESTDINKEMNDTAEDIEQDLEKVKKAVQELQQMSNFLDRKLQFNVNEELGRVVVKVVDSSTDKVIKEIPSAEVQKMQIRIKEVLGLLFDEKI